MISALAPVIRLIAAEQARRLATELQRRGAFESAEARRSRDEGRCEVAVFFQKTSAICYRQANDQRLRHEELTLLARTEA